jgi:hypothetical protein
MKRAFLAGLLMVLGSVASGLGPALALRADRDP